MRNQIWETTCHVQNHNDRRHCHHPPPPTTTYNNPTWQPRAFCQAPSRPPTKRNDLEQVGTYPGAGMEGGVSVRQAIRWRSCTFPRLVRTGTRANVLAAPQHSSGCAPRKWPICMGVGGCGREAQEFRPCDWANASLATVAASAAPSPHRTSRAGGSDDASEAPRLTGLGCSCSALRKGGVDARPVNVRAYEEGPGECQATG